MAIYNRFFGGFCVIGSMTLLPTNLAVWWMKSWPPPSPKRRSARTTFQSSLFFLSLIRFVAVSRRRRLCTCPQKMEDWPIRGTEYEVAHLILSNFHGVSSYSPNNNNLTKDGIMPVSPSPNPGKYVCVFLILQLCYSLLTSQQKQKGSGFFPCQIRARLGRWFFFTVSIQDVQCQREDPCTNDCRNRSI